MDAIANHNCVPFALCFLRYRFFCSLDAHTTPLVFLPPSVGLSANMATPSLQDTIMPLTKTPFQPQHSPLLRNDPTALFYGVIAVPQYDLQSTIATQRSVAATSAPEQFSDAVPASVTSFSLPSHGYSRLGQGPPLQHHHHPYANAQPPPLAHVISPQQLQQHKLQHQRLQGLSPLPVYPNSMILQPGQLSWTEEELSGNLRGRRSSMPTLHMDQFQQQPLPQPSHLSGFPSLSAINLTPHS